MVLNTLIIDEYDSHDGVVLENGMFFFLFIGIVCVCVCKTQELQAKRNQSRAQSLKSIDMGKNQGTTISNHIFAFIFDYNNRWRVNKSCFCFRIDFLRTFCGCIRYTHTHTHTCAPVYIPKHVRLVATKKETMTIFYDCLCQNTRSQAIHSNGFNSIRFISSNETVCEYEKDFLNIYWDIYWPMYA